MKSSLLLHTLFYGYAGTLIFPDQLVKQAVIPETLQHCTYMVPTAEDSQEHTV